MGRRLVLCAFAAFAGLAALAAQFGLDYRGHAARPGGAGLQSVAAPADAALRRTRISVAEAPALGAALAVGDELELTLFDDVVLGLELVERTPSPLGGASFLATARGYAGVRNAVVIQTEEGLQIDVQDYLRGRVYAVFSTQAGVTVKELEPTNRPVTCGAPRELPAVAPAGGDKSRPEGELARPPKLAAGSPAYVDILVVYDRLASTWVAQEGGAELFAAVSVQKMNAVLANTGLDEKFRFRLVGVREVTGRGDGDCLDGSSMDAILDSVADDTAYNDFNWGSLKTVRSQVGADLMCILTDTGYNWGTTGMGWSLRSGNVSTFAALACNCCAIRAVAESQTMTHEVGHNMGAGHATAVANAGNRGPQYYDYSSGHYFTAGGTRYHTIMAYDSDGYGNSYSLAPYFSSPDHTFKGVAVGDALHDNTRTLRNNFATVSAFRADKSQAIPLASALNTSRTIATAGDADWYGQTFFSHDGADAARSGAVGANQSSVMRTTVSGPAQVSFWWRVSSEEGYDKLTFLVDGAANGSISGTVGGWTRRTVQLDSGAHVLEWAYAKDGSGSAGEDCGWVDQFVVSPVYTISFNANGGAPAPAPLVRAAGAAYGTLPTVARAGYNFLGWYTAGAGGTQATSASSASADLTLHARWSLKTVPLATALNAAGQTFTTGGGAGWLGQVLESHDGTASARSGAVGDGLSSWLQTTVKGPADVSFWWRVSSEKDYDALSFLVDGAEKGRISGTSGGWTRLGVSLGAGSHVLKWIYAKDVSLGGGEDCGWVDQLAVSPIYTISFDANGGEPTPAPAVRAKGAAFGALPTVTREGYVFSGWYTARTGGTKVSAATKATANATLYARWAVRTLYPVAAPGGAPALDAAAVYDGMLTKDGEIAGTIQVKVAKGRPDRWSGEMRAKVTATVQLLDGTRKLVFKGGTVDASGAVTPVSAGGYALNLKLGADGLGGTLGGYVVDGARNIFAGKSAADRAVAGSVLAAWAGGVNVVSADGVASLAVNGKGKVRISGSIGGVRLSAQSQLLVGRDWCAVPVVVARGAPTAFVVWMPRAGGNVQVLGLGETVAGAPGELWDGCAFWCDGAAQLVSALPGSPLAAYLPDGVSVEPVGAKWLVAGGSRAGKVAFVKGTTVVDAEKAGANPAALKLSYKAGTGSFTGSFKAYSNEGGRIRAYALKVTGVLVNGYGYGLATLKKPACTIAVTIR